MNAKLTMLIADLICDIRSLQLADIERGRYASTSHKHSYVKAANDLCNERLSHLIEAMEEEETDVVKKQSSLSEFIVKLKERIKK